MAGLLTAGKFRICGIDPGLRRTGWGVVEVEGNRLRWVADGVVSPDPTTPDEERLRFIHDGVAAVADEHRPDAGAIEEVFVSRNPSSALKLGMARGAAMLALAQQGLAVDEIAARRVKQNLTGSGRADKAQVAAMVVRLLGVEPQTGDSADALAIAIAATSEGGGAIPDTGPAATGLDAAIARALGKQEGQAG